MKMKKRPKFDILSNDKRLKRVAFLLYEDYNVSEKELEKCKRILEDFEKRHSEGQNSLGN